MSASKPAAFLGGATSGATIGRLLGIGSLGTLLGIAAGLYLAYIITSTPTLEES